MFNLDSISDVGYIKTFKKDEVVFLQNEPGSDMYIVKSGLFGVYINSFSDFPVRLAEIQAGSYFGEMAVIDGWPRSATVIAEQESEAIVIQKEVFEFLLERIPEIGSEIMETLKNRAVAVTETVKESGIDIKELPDNIKNAKFDNASRGMVLMTMIARQIRSANENLANVNDSENKIEFQKNSSESVLKLLPLNYENYNIEDHNDNIMYLNKATVNCPYCGKVFEEYIPLFSVLKNSREFPDGRIKYYEFDILRYTNIVCSCCNYTDAYQEFFKQYETDSALKFQENQFKNAENFTGYANSLARTMDETILSYYLNLECLKRVTTAPLRYAKAWIRLYWIYNDLENEIFMKKAGERAYHYYNEYFHKSTEIISNFDKVRINTIIEQLSKFK